MTLALPRSPPIASANASPAQRVGTTAQPGQCRTKSRQSLGEPTLVPSDDTEHLGVSLPRVRAVQAQLQEFGTLCFGKFQIPTHNCQAPSGEQGHPLQEGFADVHGDLRGRIEGVLESIRNSLLQECRGQEPDCLVPGHRVVRPVGEVDGLTGQAGPPRRRLWNPCCGGWADDGVE